MAMGRDRVTQRTRPGPVPGCFRAEGQTAGGHRMESERHLLCTVPVPVQRAACRR